MKKAIIIILLIVFVINLGGKSTNKIIIPEDAIRYRVIANSNSKTDQDTKVLVRDALNDVLTPLMLSSKTKSEMKQNLSLMTPVLEDKVQSALKSQNQDETYEIQYGMNYFPQKEYQGVTYQEGEYESLVVTLGEGKGENFWCVLFPPLCLLEGEKTDSEKIEYTSLIQEILDAIF